MLNDTYIYCGAGIPLEAHGYQYGDVSILWPLEHWIKYNLYRVIEISRYKAWHEKF